MANYLKGKDASPYRHGLRHTKLYATWARIKTRCTNKRADNYKYYGGRGIKMCDEWASDFIIFKDWAFQSGYIEGLTIERVDVNLGYQPNNCRWITQKEQMSNTRRNRHIIVNGERLTVAEASRRFNLTPGTLISRLNRGWDVNRSVVENPIIGKNQYSKTC